MSEHIHTAPELEDVLRSDWCPISRALGAVANRSTFLILREAFYGTTRFDDFVKRSGSSEAITAARLKTLVEEGLLERQPYQEPGARVRYEYVLTEAGEDFFPVLAGMINWSLRWRGPIPIAFRHEGCGAPVSTVLRCEEGHEITAGEVEIARTPGAAIPARV